MCFLISFLFVSEPLSLSDFPLMPSPPHVSHATNLSPVPLESIPEEATNTPTPFPMYKRTAVFYSTQDCAAQTLYSPARGILLSPRSAPQSPMSQGPAAEDATPAGSDALGRQVRFGPAAGHGVPQQGAAEEPGEHSLLDVDRVLGAEDNIGHTAGVYRPLLKQAACGSEEMRDVLKADVGPHQVSGGKSSLQTNLLPNQQISKQLSLN